MNGSTFKLNPNGLASALMVRIEDTFDSHLINGQIQGDYGEHDYSGNDKNSEWVNGVSISGSSKYSSIEDVKIFNIVGSLVNVTLLFSIFMNILMEKEEKIYELLITIGSLIVIALTLFYSIRALVRLIKNKNNLLNNVGTSLIGIMDVVALIMCIIKILI